MTGGNVTEKQVPWWTLHEVADELDGTLRHISCVDHTGRRYKRVVIEYEEESPILKVSQGGLYTPYFAV